MGRFVVPSCRFGKSSPSFSLICVSAAHFRSSQSRRFFSSNEDILGIWTRSAQDRESIDKIRDNIRKILQLPPVGPVLEYKPHQHALADRSSYRHGTIRTGSMSEGLSSSGGSGGGGGTTNSATPAPAWKPKSLEDRRNSANSNMGSRGSDHYHSGTGMPARDSELEGGARASGTSRGPYRGSTTKPRSGSWADRDDFKSSQPRGDSGRAWR
jgi:hypothetical protein